MLPPLLPVSMLATPSIVMLLEVGRWPFTERSAICAAAVSLFRFVTTPGTRVAKVKTERPLLAMFLRASLSRVNERSPLVACSSVTRERTLISSDISPTCKARVPAENLSFAFTTTLARSRVLKPCMLTFRV